MTVSAPPLKISFAGREFSLDAVNGSDAVAIQMQQGIYEAPLPMLTMAIAARTRGLFIDVGANNGLYSILAAVARPGLMGVAFEPYPPVLDILRTNIALNALNTQIRVVECALSDFQGEAALFLPDQAHGLLETSCSLEANFKPGSSEVLKVPIRRLDDVELEDKVALIKVDIEGHEAAFLRGAKMVIQRDRPFIFAEMLPNAADSFYEMTVMMREMDYLSFRLRPDAAILSNYIRYDPLAWNYALIPEDRMPLFRKACFAHQLEIVQPF